MTAYYNEFDPRAAAWLMELIAEGLIPDGEVDERSITEVKPDELAGFEQCHFFAGIGGWPLALRLAGIPDDFEIWTGSCPCQSFSSAGKRKGFDDERHLWPAFFDLIKERRPPIVVGEQVEAAIRHGWLDLVFGDLEAEDYACGAAVLGAHSVGAPHIRQRLYWVANATSDRYRRISGIQGPEKSEIDSDREDQRLRIDEHLRAGVFNWDRWIHVPCRDGKWCPIPESVFQFSSDGVPEGMGNLRPESGFPLCEKLEGRAALIKGAGNAIVPQVAAEFLREALF